MRATFEPDEREQFYGLGHERINAFSKKGCAVDLRHLNTKAAIPYVYSSLGLFFYCACMLSHFGHIQLIYDPMDCSLPCPPPRDLPDPEIEPASVLSPALADRFFATSAYTLLIFFKQILV